MIHSKQHRGCRIQDPGARGYRWWKTADFSHMVRPRRFLMLIPQMKQIHPSGSCDDFYLPHPQQQPNHTRPGRLIEGQGVPFGTSAQLIPPPNERVHLPPARICDGTTIFMLRGLKWFQSRYAKPPYWNTSEAQNAFVIHNLKHHVSATCTFVNYEMRRSNCQRRCMPTAHRQQENPHQTCTRAGLQNRFEKTPVLVESWANSKGVTEAIGFLYKKCLKAVLLDGTCFNTSASSARTFQEHVCKAVLVCLSSKSSSHKGA